MERPALKRLLADIAARKIDVIVVYKVDRLSRSLTDFAKLVDVFDAHAISFVSVTQQFNTTTLTLRKLVFLGKNCLTRPFVCSLLSVWLRLSKFLSHMSSVWDASKTTYRC